MNLNYSNPTLINVTISGNLGENVAGGMLLWYSNPTLINVTISDNTALGGDGGGMFLWYSNPTITNVTISENTSDAGGGGMSLSNSNPLLSNVTISGNTATTGMGGGMSLNNSDPMLINLTISGNTAGWSAGGIFLGNSTNPTLINLIIWNNIPNSIDHWPEYNEEPIIAYSDIEGGWEGEGNIDADPLFTDPENGNFSLHEGSPCIDAGIADLDGDGEDDIEYLGAAPDMGAFEYGAVYGCTDPEAINFDPEANMDDGSCEYSSASEISVSYNTGWNIVGLPLYVEDASPGTLFPDAVDGTLYGYEGSYYSSGVLETGNGYWLVFTTDGSADMSGEAIASLTISLSEGWNLITGISSPVAVESISDPGSIIVSGTIYGYGGSYYNAEAIEPGKGYWLNAFADGEVTFGEGLARSRPVFEDMTAGANTLTINGQNLYFGIDIPADKMMSYSLPPKPPSGAFDIRFSGDTRIAGDKTEIEIMSPYETITISYDVVLNAGEHMNWVLSSESGKEYTLEGTGEITVPTEETFTLERKAIIPIAYTLHQNYPNPFNPITSLRYDLPEQAQVTLTVYDMLGREVTQLVNTTQEAGYKSVQWNATDMHGKPVSAGVYLYQIRAGEFVQTKKMVLLK
jgi:parallel beta-helix repeat protein